MSRGYVALGVRQPKYDGNIGGLLRAGACFGANVILLEGLPPTDSGRLERTDSRITHRHLPVIFVPDLLAATPHECVRVAVELHDDAWPLQDFVHPPAAFYIFGNEGETLSDTTLQECRHVVRIPSTRCLNLAAAANVVLYDRTAKLLRKDAAS